MIETALSKRRFHEVSAGRETHAVASSSYYRFRESYASPKGGAAAASTSSAARSWLSRSEGGASVGPSPSLPPDEVLALSEDDLDKGRHGHGSRCVPYSSPPPSPPQSVFRLSPTDIRGPSFAAQSSFMNRRPPPIRTVTSSCSSGSGSGTRDAPVTARLSKAASESPFKCSSINRSHDASSTTSSTSGARRSLVCCPPTAPKGQQQAPQFIFASATPTSVMELDPIFGVHVYNSASGSPATLSSSSSSTTTSNKAASTTPRTLWSRRGSSSGRGRSGPTSQMAEI